MTFSWWTSRTGAVVAAAAAFAVQLGCKGSSERLRMDPVRAITDARTTLLSAAQDPDQETRAHAMEATGEVLGRQGGATLAQGLSDPSPAVRFAAAMAIGDAQYENAKDRLVSMAEDKQVEPDKRVLTAVIYALYRLADTKHVGPLGEMLFDPEKEIRADAAMVMGKMGEPSAVGPLRMALADEQDPGVQLQIIEALAKLNDSRSANLLEAYTKTSFLDERLLAIPAMVDARSPRAAAVMSDLTNDREPPQVRVAAAGALARLGTPNAETYEFCLLAAKDPHGVLQKALERHSQVTAVQISSLQRLAVLALGWMERQAAVDVLHPLLGSPDGAVRVAASMSILRLLSAYQPAAPPPGDASINTGPAARPRVPPRPKLYTAGGKD